MKTNKTILGIDPGTNRMGYGAIRTEGSKIIILDYGVIELAKGQGPHKLLELSNSLSEIIERISPDTISVERLFFSNNQKTALQVAEARGAIMVAAARSGAKIIEITPNEVKSTVAGYGSADKKAVMKMVQLILGIKDFKSIDDASDALAIALATSMDAGKEA